MAKHKKDTRTKDASKYYKDEPESGYSAEELLSVARLALMRDQPFFGKISQNMSFVENNMFPTTAVSPKGQLFFNRKWVNGFTLEDAVFEFGHETMHLVQRCFTRKPKEADPGLWNMAADWVADTTLKDAGLTQSAVSLEMVPEKVQDKVRELGYTIEYVYQYLLEKGEEHGCKACKKEREKVNKQAGDCKSDQGDEKEQEGKGDEQEGEGSGCGDEGNEPHTCMNIRQCCAGTTADFGENGDPMLEQEWVEKLIAAKMHAESQGNMPAALGEAIDSLTKSTVRWQDYLKTAATKVFGRDRYTFKRLNRRARGMGKLGMRLPRQQPDGKSAVIAFDTSGSMSEDEVRQSLSEAAEIMIQCGARTLFVIMHDMVVYYADEVGKDALTKLKIARGGTSHYDVFKILDGKTVRRNGEEFKLPDNTTVELAVLFTDLGTSFDIPKPSFDVIWAVPSDGCPGPSQSVPFGQKVVMDMEQYRNGK